MYILYLNKADFSYGLVPLEMGNIFESNHFLATIPCHSELSDMSDGLSQMKNRSGIDR